MAAASYFPPRAAERVAMARFASRSKIAGLRHPSLSLRPCASLSGSGPFRPPSQVIATKAAMGAAEPAKDLPHDRP